VVRAKQPYKQAKDPHIDSKEQSAFQLNPFSERSPHHQCFDNVTNPIMALHKE